MASWPDNFVPRTAFFAADAAACGTAQQTTGIGFSSTFRRATVRSTERVQVADEITVTFHGWSGGSTGNVAFVAEISPDNSTWTTCGTAAAHNYLNNNTADVVTCESPFTSNELYVRLGTATVSPALIFVRSVQVETCASGVAVPTVSEWGMIIMLAAMAAIVALGTRRRSLGTA